MNYWVIKGSPRWNEWDEMLVPNQTGLWRTKRLARQLSKGDRVFFWESGSKLRMIALGEIVRPNQGKDRHGFSLYRVRYLTQRLKEMPGIGELRRIKALTDASFLKAGPATSIFPLTSSQGRTVFSLLSRNDPALKMVWRDLADARFPGFKLLPDIDQSAFEGSPKLVLHIRRERNPRLIAQKKAQVLKQESCLACECCGFDFKAVYGTVGAEFCEVHHTKALGSPRHPRKTQLRELAIVCSNCHRIIHRSKPMLSISQLKEIIARRRKHRARREGLYVSAIREGLAELDRGRWISHRDVRREFAS